MKEFNLEEYNKLCAEFLEWVFQHGYYNPNHLHEYSFETDESLKFHSDWNWIMEVVEKIEQLGYRFNINNFDGNYAEIRSGSCIDEKISDSSDLDKEFISKKEAAVQSIWEFLNWYKENEAVHIRTKPTKNKQ